MGERIKAYLNAQGIKKKYVSEKAGITTFAFGAILDGKRRMTVEEYIRICKALNVNFEMFIE